MQVRILLLSLNSIFSVNYLYKGHITKRYTEYWYLKITSKGFKRYFDTFFINPVLTELKLKGNCKSVYNADNFKIYFLKKEVYYTKLKYSRVPQFDTASGAVASFISGMYGFMVCERFGFELLDSGDFIYMVLYIIVFALVLANLTTVLNSKGSLLKDITSLINSFSLN